MEGGRGNANVLGSNHLVLLNLTRHSSLSKEENNQKTSCPECHSRLLIQDAESGDVVCGRCGYVIMERTERPGREWRSLEEVAMRERAGAPLSLRKPDLGLATTIGAKKGAEKLRFWEKRTFYTPRQRSLRKGLKIIDILASRLNLGHVATDQSAYIYRKAVNARFLKGRSIRSVAATAVYSSCREHGIPRSLDEVAWVGGIDKKVLSRYYRSLIECFEIKMPKVEPEQYVATYASALSINEKTARKAYSILRRAKRNGLVAGMDPRGLAAGALYIASLSAEKHPLQQELANASGVSSVTLRKRAQLLRKYLGEEELPATASR